MNFCIGKRQDVGHCILAIGSIIGWSGLAYAQDTGSVSTDVV